MKTIHLNHRTMPEEARRLFRLAFPSYRGQQYKIRGVDYPIDLRSYWDGGCRDYYAIVRADGATMPVPQQSAFDKALRGAEAFTIPDGVVVVERRIYRSKEMGLTLIVPMHRLAAFLPAPTVTLTDEQRTVLDLTARYVPSCRREYAARAGIGAARWAELVEELAELKLLRRNGSITPEGRNAL